MKMKAVGSRAAVCNPHPCQVLKYFHTEFFEASDSTSLCSYALQGQEKTNSVQQMFWPQFTIRVQMSSSPTSNSSQFRNRIWLDFWWPLFPYTSHPDHLSPSSNSNSPPPQGVSPGSASSPAQSCRLLHSESG